MNRNGNTYTFIYASVMVIIVAAVLSFVALKLKPYQTQNVQIEKKQNILQSVGIKAEATEAEAIYAEKITASYIVNSKGEIVDGDAFAIDLKKEQAKPVEERNLPIYEATLDGSVKYIIPLRGTGLWGPIWGYISLNNDMNTVYGAVFDHASETPGLGAEIVTEHFQGQFTDKQIFDPDGKFTALVVAKAGESASEIHKVDGISGGTMTSKGVQEMLLKDLSLYVEFFNKKKTE